MSTSGERGGRGSCSWTGGADYFTPRTLSRGHCPGRTATSTFGEQGGVDALHVEAEKARLGG